MNQPTLTPTNPETASFSRPVNAAPKLKRFASAEFHNTLDGILQRECSDDELRADLLLAALQHAGFVGAGWYRLESSQFHAKAELFEHPALQSETLRASIKDQAQAAAQQRRELIAPHTAVRNLVQLSVPVAELDAGPDVIVLLTTEADPKHLESAVHVARSLARASALRHAWRDLTSAGVQLRATAALLELTEQLESARSLAEAHRLLADTVRNHLHCKFVAVGFKHPSRVTCQVAAVAGIAEFDQRSNPTRRLKAALDESLVRGEFTSWPVTAADAALQPLALRQLAECNQVSVVVSVPLKCSDGEVVGALVVGGEENLLALDAVRFVETLDVPAGTALRAVRQAQGGPLRQLTRKLGSAKGRTTVLTAAALLATIAGGLLIPVPYRIGCAFRCEPVQSHFTVAPYDGVLESALVEPGDAVVAGQLLAKMDASEVRWELVGLMADSSRAGKKRDVHLADEQIADSIMASLEVERLQSRRDLLEGRLDQLDIRSSVDGIVLSGSLDKKENFPVEVGQKLYEIAGVDTVRMEIAIPDIEVDHVREGMPVQFRPDSDPLRVVDGSIRRIRPRSEIVNDRNVFVAEVIIENADGRLRPGMEGLARVKGDPHSLGWNLFHKAWEYTMSRILW